MVRYVVGVFALSAVFCATGCAGSLVQEPTEHPSVRFAVVEPAGRCTNGGSAHTIATDVRERDLEAAGGDDGFAVRFTQKKSAKTHTVGSGAVLASPVTATIDEEWVTVDGMRLWRALQPVQWIHAVRDGERIAVVMVSNGKLLAGAAGRGILHGPLHTLGTASLGDSAPDVVIQNGKIAVTWEGVEGAFVGGFTVEHGWNVHSIPTPPDAKIMDPRVAPVSGGRFIVLWREGTMDHHGLRAQIYNEDARPVGGSFDPAPGLEVVRADVAAKPDGEVLVASLVATGKGLDLVTSPMRCNVD
jgi:hypothetical protein